MTKKVLGLDIGFGICGWAVMQDYRPLEWGLITTDKDNDFLERLEELQTDIKSLLSIHKPDIVGIENPVFLGHNTNASLVVQALGVARLAIMQAGYPEKLVYPTQVKAAVANGTAKKKDIKKAVKEMFDIARFHEDDEADAIAIAYCASQLV